MLEIFSLIITVILNALLGLIVFLNNRKSSLNQAFLVLTFSFAAYGVINYYSLHPRLLDQLTWIRLDVANGAMILMFLYLTFSLFPKGKFEGSKTFRIVFVILGFTTLFLCLTPFVFQRVNYASGHAQPVPGFGIVFYALFQLLAVVITVITLFKQHRIASGMEREQLRYVIGGVILSLLLILIFNFILVQIFHITQYVALGATSSLIFTGSFAYAVITKRLFDIRLVVARSLAYLLSVSLLGMMYGFITFQVGSLIFQGSNVSAAQQTLNTSLAVILAFTFQPLRRFFEKITDRIFYRDHYDPQTLVNDIGHILASEIDLHQLGGEVIKLLCAQMRLAKVDLLVFEGQALFFEAHTLATDQNRRVFDPADLLLLGRAITLGDELAPGAQKDLFGKYRISASVPLASSNEFIGYLLLGEKRSGDIFNETDGRTLRILASELAVAIQNAKSYTQIQHFNETLQAKIEQATRQLRDANVHLKELDEIKDEFMSMASHQLGTPLAVIDGYISMVTSGIYGPLGGKQKPPLDSALKRVRLMKRLVADFLNVSRIQAGRFFFEVAPTDLNKLVPEEVENLTERAREKRVKVEYVKPARPVPSILIDEQKIRQAMMNLIDNAIYYAPKGVVKIQLDSDGTEVSFRVTDNGIGVPEAQKARLFAKFFRADNAKRERPNGTGIGLFLVKKVVEDQGGRIIFDSREGHGSTFGFVLPIKNPVTAKLAQPAAPSEPSGESLVAGGHHAAGPKPPEQIE